MKPEPDFCSRSLSSPSLSRFASRSLTPWLRALSLWNSRLHAGCAAFALLGLILAGPNSISQEPTPIPNWTPTQPASGTGQYTPNQQYDEPDQQPGGTQQYGYGYGSQPSQQYGQSQYQQQDSNQLQAYGDIPDQGSAPPYQSHPAVTPDQLEQMVAPIALYPDNLVSMILAASTYPAQVVAANQWLHAMGSTPPEQIAAAANAQTSWDPSVKALTAFPQVLDTLARNLQWTTDLGNAYYNQPQDVMQTIQVMRGRAQTAGNLQDTPQQDVIEDQGNIQIAPPTPEVVYVPQYDPWMVYGQPVAPYPGFNWAVGIGSVMGNAFVSWGPGIAVDAFAFTPFGWLGWGLDWFAHAIYFGQNVWCTHSWQVHDWGYAHGGARYWGSHGELARWHEHGDWSGRGGWNHTFRSGLDRARFGNGGHPEPRFGGGGERGGFSGRNGGNYGHSFAGNGGEIWSRGNNGYGRQDRGNGGQNGGSWAHSGNGQGYGRNGNSYGSQNVPRGGNYANGGTGGRVQSGRGLSFGYNGANGGYGQQGRAPSQGYQAYNRGPQAIGGPQQSRGFQGGYGYPTARAFGNNYGGGYAGSYSRSQQYSGARPSFGGSYTQPYRSPSFSSRSYGSGNGYGNRAFSYGGASAARAPVARGFGSFGRSSGGYSYGGGSFKAPRAPSGHSFGGGSHFSGGGGHSFGGSSHFGGGGGHFGGGGGRSSGGHSGGGHHR